MVRKFTSFHQLFDCWCLASCRLCFGALGCRRHRCINDKRCDSNSSCGHLRKGSVAQIHERLPGKICSKDFTLEARRPIVQARSKSRFQITSADQNRRPKPQTRTADQNCRPKPQTEGLAFVATFADIFERDPNLFEILSAFLNSTEQFVHARHNIQREEGRHRDATDDGDGHRDRGLGTSPE